MMQRYENSPEAIRDAGIAYAIDQIIDLVSNGVDGIHLYTMNNAYVANRIYEATKNII
jgi:methylenetetrahydrofolate reductase (NADPH)